MRPLELRTRESGRVDAVRLRADRVRPPPPRPRPLGAHLRHSCAATWSGGACEVRHVANVTDIDDKIIERARREGRSEPEVAAEWEAVYIDAMGALGVLAPHDRPRATEWVSQMVDFVEVLVSTGGAYVTESGVYLRVREVPGYGDLVHRDLDDLRASAGSRVEVDETKEDPLDFALWKSAKPGEPTWESPWGAGRPGWHIECAAMSLALLGDGFDLHGGGDDLVFPHHTNERAEARAAGRRFARHWMHNAMLNVGGHKMAKSLGNFRTVADLLAEHPRNGRALRLLVLQTHYRKTMEVNAQLMAAARTAAARLDTLARRARSMLPGASSSNADVADLAQFAAGLGDGEIAGEAAGSVGAGPGDQVDEVAQGAVVSFRRAMDDDMGTPEAVAVMFDTLRRANAAIDAGAEEAGSLSATALGLAAVLGLEPVPDSGRSGAGGSGAATSSHGSPENASADAPGSGDAAAGDPAAGDPGALDDAEIDQLLAQREEARKLKDWATADSIRDRLADCGVVLEDGPSGTVWYRR